jgi:hypothetical protein
MTYIITLLIALSLNTDSKTVYGKSTPGTKLDHGVLA